jgi:glutathione S-transferase
LRILDEQFSARPFIVGDGYTIADISIFAYAHLANEAGLSTADLPNFRAWIDRIRSAPGFLAKMYPYDIDPHATAELP